MLLTNKLVHYKNSQFVVECLEGPFDIIDIVIPHQLIYQYKNFWGDTVTVLKQPKHDKLEPVKNNQPIANTILSVITNEFQSFEQINNKLRQLGYYPNIDLKTVYWKYMDILERNEKWEIRFK